ncbi:MAG TPA: hypothetical protein PK746_02540 [Spirochaetales bacterium]|nr:hypothetical protein [Spirochaetales bacterium]
MNKKKLILVYFLWLSTIFISAQTIVYYSSDENYSILETISETEIQNYDYYIKLINNAERQEYIYFNKGEIQKRIVVTQTDDGKQEEEWQDDLMTALRIYRGQQLVSEKIYNTTEAEYITHDYFYKNNILEKIVVTPQNKKSYEIIYIYDASNKIRALLIHDKVISLSQFSGASIFSKWNQTIFSIEVYTVQMLLQFRFDYDATGKCIFEEERLYQNSVLTTIKQNNYSNNNYRTVTYSNSLIQEEQTFSLNKKELLETIQYVYDEQNLLIKKIILSKKETTVFEYTYDNKKVIEEKKYSNGILKQITRWISDSMSVVELYENDGVIIKITYNNGKKVKEEAWLNSDKIYEKDYE